MRAALYTRISRDDLGDGLGVARQQEDCQTLCLRRGWSVSHVFADNDVSAFSGRTRPAYQSLLRAVDARQADVVVAWAPERLHRSPRELEDFLELIERTGTGVETVKAGAWDVSTSHGRLVARMLGAVSRAESERTGERVSRAHQQAKERGMWRGPIPYGMRATTVPGRPEPDEAQAAVVRDIFRRVQQGESLTRIAAELNDRDIKPRRGQAWTHTGIARLVASPALGGMVELDGELRPAAFTGVVEAEDWRAVRSVLKRRPKGEARRPREKLTLLGGIMICDEHGHPCFGGGAAHAATYVATGPGRCNVSITRDAADSLITELVIGRLSRPDAQAAMSPAHDLPDLEREAQGLRQRREELADLLAEGLMTASVARPRLAALAQRLDEIEGQRTPAMLPPESYSDPVKAWLSWTVVQRREAVRLLFERISLRHTGGRGGPRADPTRITVAWAH